MPKTKQMIAKRQHNNSIIEITANLRASRRIANLRFTGELEDLNIKGITLAQITDQREPGKENRAKPWS